MIVKRIVDRITRGRLLTPNELKIYRQNQQNIAYMFHEIYVPCILSKYPFTKNLDKEVFERVKMKLAVLLYSDLSLLESENLESTIQNIVYEAYEK